MLFCSLSICLPLEFLAIQKKGSCCIFPSNILPFGDRSLLSQHQLNVLLEHQSQIVKLTELAEFRITQLSFISRLCLLLWSSKRERDLLRLEQIYLKSLVFFQIFKNASGIFLPFFLLYVRLSRHFFQVNAQDYWETWKMSDKKNIYRYQRSTNHYWFQYRSISISG